MACAVKFGSPCSLNLRLSSQSWGWAGGFCVHSLCSGNDAREEEKKTAESEKLELQSKESLPAKEGESCGFSPAADLVLCLQSCPGDSESRKVRPGAPGWLSQLCV